MIKREFLEGRIVVYNADCMDVMREIGDKEIDLVLTDPPYRNQQDNQPTKDMRKNGLINNFGDRPNDQMINEIFRISKNQIIWGANNFNNLPSYKGFLIWDKGIPFNFTMSSVEMAFISEKLSTIAKMFYSRASGQDDRFHPTQKPVNLFNWCLQNNSKENDLIFDGFLGSGTTAISCIRTNRRLIGAELDPIYFEKMCFRIEEELRQPNLF